MSKSKFISSVKSGLKSTAMVATVATLGLTACGKNSCMFKGKKHSCSSSTKEEKMNCATHKAGKMSCSGSKKSM